MMPNAPETIERLSRSDERKAMLLEKFLSVDANDSNAMKQLQDEVRQYLENTRN